MRYDIENISIMEAMKIAENEARLTLNIENESEISLLSDRYLEAESCWMFFVNEDIKLSSEITIGLKWAYVVSKKGAFAMVQDLSGDENSLKDYLVKMSDYFKKRNE
jgi:hypothetical protein